MPAKPKAAKPIPPGTKIAVKGITPFLWFKDNAQEAAEFYVALFKGSKIRSRSPQSVEFTLAGQDFYALNGGPHYQLTPAYSMFVEVTTQQEVDYLWNALTADGGQESMCGWLVDKFGLSWQVIPTKLPKLLYHKDPGVAQRAMEAMLKMQKIDIATLERAAKGK